MDSEPLRGRVARGPQTLPAPSSCCPSRPACDNGGGGAWGGWAGTSQSPRRRGPRAWSPAGNTGRDVTPMMLHGVFGGRVGVDKDTCTARKKIRESRVLQ
eukprot:872756-Prorocentrum_minimum.AAC.1